MASRESQGLQVALILFVMVTVVLAVTTYVYFRKAEEKIKEAAAARSENTTAKRAMDESVYKAQLLKHMLGEEQKTEAERETIWGQLQNSPDLKQLKEYWANFESDMAMYGAGYETQTPAPSEPLSYRSLPKYLMTAINSKNAQLTAATDTQRKLEQERDSQKLAEKNRADAAETAMTAAQTDAAQEKTKFDTLRQTYVARVNQMAAQLPVKDQELAAERARLTGDNEQLKRQLEQTTLLYQALRQKALDEQAPTYERADGEITMVNESARLVWINLGQADGVQRMMTFSVIDRDAVGVTDEDIKGTIEVTRVRDAHLSEARIVSQADLATPLMEDDKIYSPSFRKGQKTHFALVGIMDIDDDGKSDRDRVRSLITTNGGVIDVELLDNGTVSGKMTVHTKYLVKGDQPTDKTNDAKLLKGYSELIEEATKLGVQSITVNKLFDLMGYFPETHVVPLSRGGGSGGTGGNARPKFKPRTPPRSAYP